MSQSERARHLKLLSENAFKDLCGKLGLAPTQPEEDENGWDFLLEFPPNRESGVPLDEQAPAIKCLVQVKSTDNFSRSALPITVSRLDQLCRATLPTFVAIFDYAGGDVCDELYLCHVYEDRMHAVFKRVRVLESKNKKELHLHRMQFAARTEEKIQIAPYTLSDAIRHYAGYDLREYEKKKADLVKKIGFDDKPVVVRFATSVKIENMVDAMLGIGDGVRIVEGTVSKKRFGIELLDHEIEAGVLTIHPVPAGKCHICGILPDQDEIVEVEADVIAPQGGWVPREHFKLRIVAAGIEATIQDKKEAGNLEIKIDPNKIFDFSSLLNVSALSSLLCKRGAEIEFRKDGQMFARALMPKLEESEYHTFLAGRLKIVECMLSKANFREKISVKPIDIIEDAEFKWLALAASKDEESQLDWTHDVHVPAYSTKGIVAAIVALKCDNKYICFFCYWQAQFEIEGKNAFVKISSMKVYRTMQVGEDDVAVLQRRFDEFHAFCTKKDQALLFLGPEPSRLFETTSLLDGANRTAASTPFALGSS